MSCRVLVVDDEPLMLRLWSRIFRLLKCSVTGHSSGSDALKNLREQRFDIVITDLRMPEFSGYDLLHALQNDPLSYYPKLFVCSGFFAADDDFRQLGVTRLIHKPFDIDTEVDFFRDLVRKVEANG